MKEGQTKSRNTALEMIAEIQVRTGDGLAKVQLTTSGHICGPVCICNLMKQNSKEDMLELPCM